MTEFRYSVCEPLNPEIIEKGVVSPNHIIELFNDFQWDYYLKQVKTAETRGEDIYFSPSLEIENKANKNGLTISAVGDPDNYEFYIFYKRPKTVMKKKLFRKPEAVIKDYISEITGQTKEEAIEYLNALLADNLELLESRIK